MTLILIEANLPSTLAEVMNVLYIYLITFQHIIMQLQQTAK